MLNSPIDTNPPHKIHSNIPHNITPPICRFNIKILDNSNLPITTSNRSIIN